jgi:hypothetical protein
LLGEVRPRPTERVEHQAQTLLTFGLVLQPRIDALGLSLSNALIRYLWSVRPVSRMAARHATAPLAGRLQVRGRSIQWPGQDFEATMSWMTSWISALTALLAGVGGRVTLVAQTTRRDIRSLAIRDAFVELMYRYPRGNWFDDHPDASVARRDGTDRALRKVAGFHGAPIAEKSLADS